MMAGMRSKPINAPTGKTEKGQSGGNKKQYEIAIEYAESIIASTTMLKDLITQLRDGTASNRGLVGLWGLSYTFKHLFEWQIDGQPSGPSRGARLSIRKLGPRDLKRRLLNTTIELARVRLHIGGGGRRPGSKNKKRPAEAQKKTNTRKEKILRAISAVHKEAIRRVGEFKADDKITKMAVAGEIGISRTTLNNWLKESGLKFEALVDEVLGASRKK